MRVLAIQILVCLPGVTEACYLLLMPKVFTEKLMCAPKTKALTPMGLPFCFILIINHTQEIIPVLE